MKPFVRLLVAVALVLGTSLAGPAVRPAQADGGTLFAFGDSVAAGEGSGPGAGYPASRGSFNEILADRNDWRVQNFAQTGATTVDVRETQLLQAQQTGIWPSLITLTVGANDIGYVQCLLAMVGTADDAPCAPDQLQVKLTALGASLAQTLGALKTVYPEARIALLTYYNPMPKPGAACRAMQPLLEAKLLFADGDPQAFVTSATSDSSVDDAAFQAQVFTATGAIVGALNETLRTVVAAVGGEDVATVVPLTFANHDFCRDYDRKSPAWVFAPAIRTSGSVVVQGTTVPLGTTVLPRHRCVDGFTCTPLIGPPQVLLEAPANPFGITYRFALWANDFPHLTPAGNRAVADQVARWLRLRRS